MAFAVFVLEKWQVRVKFLVLKNLLGKAMSKYSFSQLIIEILTQIRGARMKTCGSTSNPINEVVEQNFITEGDLILANFFVAPPRSFSKQLRRCFANLDTRSNLQLRKESI